MKYVREDRRVLKDAFGAGAVGKMIGQAIAACPFLQKLAFRLNVQKFSVSFADMARGVT